MAASTVTAMTTSRRTTGAALAREVRQAPVTTLLGPLALAGIGAWLMATTPAWWAGLLLVLAGACLLAYGLASAAATATGHGGPARWRHATGADAHHSPDA